RQIWPHYLRPVPSCTIINFEPKSNTKAVSIPAGTYVESKPIEGISCKYKTCYDVDIYPVKIMDAKYHESDGASPFIRITLNTNTGVTATQLNTDKFNFFLGRGMEKAAELYFVLMNNLDQIVIRNNVNKEETMLEKSYLQPMGFSESEALLPFPDNAFDGYRLLQEYFHMPEKFLFWEMAGLEQWTDRKKVTEFYIDLELTKAPEDFFEVTKDSFVLSSTPAVNVFSHPAAPISVDHKKTEYRVNPEGKDRTKYQIYSIEKVTGAFKEVGTTPEFEAFHSFKSRDNSFVYHETIKKSPLYDRVDYDISLAYPEKFSSYDLKLLSFDLLCTNGNLPEMIGNGGISVPPVAFAGSVKCKNLTQPTTAILPPIGSNVLWHLVSQLTINSASLANMDNLKALLNLHLMKQGNRDKKRILANEKRINSIKEIETGNIELLINGSITKGLELRLKISQSHFSGAGDFYLFGMILDVFFGLYSSINTFTKLVIKEIDTGETFSWNPRLGSRQLI
ncbi:MAG: type VI secretion system baseplate subunit TssF, partial [Desulfobacteraceae bacterium]|nr:type VI secretion system baseplate subunit TssF [Desulfobacteraceae bacterium]